MYNSVQVSDTLTEVKFLEQFILNLSSETSKVTSVTSFEDLETAYVEAAESSNAEPSFQINIGSSYCLVFSHPKTSGTYASGLKVKLRKITGTNTYSDIVTLTENLKLGNGTEATPDIAAERKIYYIIAANLNVVSLTIGSYNTNLDNNWDFDLCFLLDDTVTAVAEAHSTASGVYVTSSPAADSNFLFSNTASTISAYDRMGYSFSSANTVEYTNSKTFLNSSVVHYSTPNMIDCSLVADAHKQIIIDNNTYYSLNENTLISV